jgi:hypothetical protein
MLAVNIGGEASVKGWAFKRAAFYGQRIAERAALEPVETPENAEELQTLAKLRKRSKRARR